MSSARRLVLSGIVALAILLLLLRLFVFAHGPGRHRFRGSGSDEPAAARVHAACYTTSAGGATQPWTGVFGDGTPDFPRLTNPANQAAFREYVYLLKVVNAGKFAISPAQAGPMYLLQIEATSDPATVEVQP
jgi:hypothetical protein